jgi:16S rRNA (uracil1498-N3)-methyltransferase
MRINRIYTSQNLFVGGSLELDEGSARHLVQVLRLKSGAELRLFNGDGKEYSARLHTAGKRSAGVDILGCLGEEPEAALHIHLGIGISKGERMDFALQKAVELGISAITPLVTERCVVRISGERQEKRLAHWHGVVVSACEQSGRCRLPRLNPAASLGEWLTGIGETGGIFLDHRAGKCLHQLTPPEGEFGVLVGPEGGLSGAERQAGLTAGLLGIRLGPRILRTETAPLAAIAAMQMLWGDFRL